MTGCRQHQERVWAALDGELSAPDLRALEAHAATCAACARELSAARRLQGALERLAQAPVAPVDVDHSVAEIRAAIDRRARLEVAPPARVSGPVRWLWRAAAVAAAVLAVWLFAGRGGDRGDGTPGAPPDVVEVPGVPAPVPPPDALPGTAPDPQHPGAPEDGVRTARQEPPRAREPEAVSDTTARPGALALPDLDVDELAAAREDVRAALLQEQAARAAEPRSGPQFAAGVEARLRGLGRSGWPVARLVEVHATAADPALATAALTYLGARCDALALRALQAALADPARKSAALDALSDAGDAALPALVAALGDPDLHDRAAATLRAAGLETAAPHLERALRGPAKRPARDAAIAALLAFDGAGLRQLVDLAANGVVAPDELESVLARTPGAPQAFVAELDRITDPAGQRVALRLAGALGCAGTEPWIQSIARERLRRGDDRILREAATALAALEGEESVQAILELPARSRADREVIEAALGERFAHDPQGVLAAARRLRREGPADRLRALHSALMADLPVALVPALLEVAQSDALSVSERRWSLLLAGETATPQNVPALLELYGRLDRGDRELRAAALVALYAVDGRAAVEPALASAAPRAHDRILGLLEARDARERPATTQARLVRELQPLLPDVHP